MQAGTQMQQIDEHERRLTVALARIAAAMERMSVPAQPVMVPAQVESDAAAEVEIARLKRLLEDARAENAEMVGHLNQMFDHHDATVAALEARNGLQQGQIEGLNEDLLRQRRMVETLRVELASAREAMQAGLGDEGRVNAALRLELEALEATRESQAAEMAVLLDTLEPLVGEAEELAALAPLSGTAAAAALKEATHA